MDAVTLHKQGQAIAAHAHIRYTIVAYQRKCRYQYLSSITGVCQTLRIAHHSRVEYHLTYRLSLIAERVAVEHRAIAEYQSCFSLHHLFNLFTLYFLPYPRS